MKVIYGKEAKRIDLTPAVRDISWSSSRGQIAQTCEISIENPPPLETAGFLMLFSNHLQESEQIFHGPIVAHRRDERTDHVSATAYELAWYLQKNERSRTQVKGEAGKELERLIRATGISFTCPSFGFAVNERLSSQSYGSLFSHMTTQAFEKTGVRYFLQHQRDKLSVVREGGNLLVPLFRASMLTSSSTGESMEEVYTIVTVERYANDKQVNSVTRENSGLLQSIGRLQKVIDAGEEKNLSALADKRIAELSKLPKTRSISVIHEDTIAAHLRAGWAIKIEEKDKKTTTDWIVTSCHARWKGGQYSMDLELERR